MLEKLIQKRNGRTRDYLTKYQRATVAHLDKVFEKRIAYIVADEVGLGKTYVSIGLIEKKDYKRIIYIASNKEIATQNKDKLCDGLRKIDKRVTIVGKDSDNDRLSLMTEEIYDENQCYLMALSPATTFTGKGSDIGNKKERTHYIKNLDLSEEEKNCLMS